MKKNYSTFLLLFLISILFTYCNSGNEDKNVEGENKKVENPKSETSIQPDSDKVYLLNEALSNNFVSISADGIGTYTKIKVNLENNTNQQIQINLPAGLYFENPDKNAQSLITAVKKDKLRLGGMEKTNFEISSYCTNVKQAVPGYLKNWKYISNYDGGLDEVIAFYGNYELAINAWLEKKNPKFSEESYRSLFFQTIIWLHEGGEYSEILKMLSQGVFKNDIDKAKEWLDSIYNEAKELAQIIKERDIEKMKVWIKEGTLKLIPSNETIDRTVEKGKEGLNRLRTRLKSN